VHIEAPTTTSVTSSVNPSSFHQSVTFTAKVVGAFGATPIGFVTFKNGGVAMGGAVALSGGMATFSTSTLTVGNHSITVSYAGNGKNRPSVSPVLTQTVKKASTKTTLTSSVNPSSFHQSVTFTATVARAFGGTASGTVTFKNGTVVLGTGAVNSSGVATFSSTALTVAVHSIAASYGGDGNFLSSASSPLAQTVNKANTTTALSSSLNPSHKGNAVTFTATVTGAFGGSPAGTVTFKDGATVLGTGSVNTTTHKATFTTSTLAVGTHPIKAIYQGNGSFHSSDSAIVNQVVNP
jgi:diadenosine tetraphosphatase ApaH/serine/threonine PP2A family protein phosphatase